MNNSSLAKSALRFAAVVIALWFAAESQAQPIADSKNKIAPVVPLRAEPFALPDVRLLDGPFRAAMELDAKVLLSLEQDRLLS